MATKKFKGFSLITTAQTPSDKDTLYFVRTNNGKTDGYLYFNGKKYGTAEDVKGALEKKYGDLMFDGSAVTISKYVEEQIKTVNTAATALAGRVNTLESTVGDASKGLVKKADDNAAAIATLNDGETVEGSVKKAVADAKKALVGNDKTEDTIKYAEKLANDAKTAASNEETRAKGVEAGLRTDVDKKVASVAGADAIITAGTATAPVVKLKLADTQGNVVLSQDTDGLKASVDLSAFGVKGVAANDKVIAVAKDTGMLSSTIAFSVDAAADTDGKKYLRLTGIDGADLGKVDVAEFVKDGMLTNAEYSTATHKITLTFNTDAGIKPIELDLNDLVNIYRAGDGLVLATDGTFSVTNDVVRKAALDTLSGSVVANENAIATLNDGETVEGSVKKAVADAKKALVGDASATAQTIGEVEKSLNAFSAATIENAVTLKIENSDKYLQATKTDGKNEYTIASKGIDDAIKTAADAVKVTVNGATYVTGAVDTAGRVITLSEKVQAVASADENSAKGLAEASDVKKYVDNKVAGKNVEASGDDYVKAEVTEGTNKVMVSAQQKLQDAVTTAESVVENGTITKANNAVKSVNGITGETVVVEDKDIAISAAISNQAKGTKINAVLADIYSKIGLVKVSSTNKTITVDDTGRIVDVNIESVDKAQAAGHVALEHGTDGALYGVMYYSGDDAEE